MMQYAHWQKWSTMKLMAKSLCVFVNLSKASYTVDHETLLEKLYSSGIRGRTYDLLRSYLSDRQQMVCVNDVVNQSRKVKCGEPQGTFLGPFLFTVYINNLLKMRIDETVLGFLDDTAIFFISDTWLDLRKRAQKTMRVLKSWMWLRWSSYHLHHGVFHPGALRVDQDTLIPEAESVVAAFIRASRETRIVDFW